MIKIHVEACTRGGTVIEEADFECGAFSFTEIVKRLWNLGFKRVF